MNTNTPAPMGTVPKTDPYEDQLIDDVNAVYFTHKKKMSDFPAPYQVKIRNGYRFSGYLRSTGEFNPPPMSRDTLDIV